MARNLTQLDDDAYIPPELIGAKGVTLEQFEEFWLIDPFKRQVYIYRPGEEVVILDNPEMVSADPLLPGFTLNLTELWSE